MTSRTRPKAEVQEEMKKLEEVGLGEFHCFSSKESAFYKVIPEEDSRELTASVIGDKINGKFTSRNFWQLTIDTLQQRNMITF